MLRDVVFAAKNGDNVVYEYLFHLIQFHRQLLEREAIACLGMKYCRMRNINCEMQRERRDLMCQIVMRSNVKHVLDRTG